ncbi:chromaffin granule amine transporter-like, partial [Colias croceus]|uniref:chromaffin granule amine transporter-like n=1 Tax=Colias crocea TaxID=72248 RepID=UPI001E280983
MQYARLGAPAAEHAAFLLVYFTFFLDNVLLTVLVPIIPDWVRGESLALWAERAAPLAQLLNSTVQRVADEEGSGIGASQLVVGAVLGAKAGVQLAMAPAAAAATERLGPARCLRLATLLLALAAIMFACCGLWCGGAGCAVCAGAGRGAQGAGAALAGVAGLALVSRARRPKQLAALLGAVALGVLVGYPFGGVAYKLWSEAAPFQLIAVAFVVNIGMQYLFLNKPECNEVCGSGGSGGSGGSDGAGTYRSSSREVWAERRGAGGAGAGAVLAATALLAALEPCLPLWAMRRFRPPRWAAGALFVPDSAGYLLATLLAGARAPERAALGGALLAGLGALLLPGARSLGELAAAQGAVGAGVGALDAALVPALLAGCPARRVPARAALLQAAASAALALGPVVGGVLSYALGFATALRLLALANLLHAALLYRALRQFPLSEQVTCLRDSAA